MGAELGTIIGLFFVLLRKVPLFSLRILEISLLGTSCYLMGLWSYLTASRERNIAANWTVLNLSVAVPITASVLWFHDTLTFSKVIGILLTLVAVVLVGEIGVKEVGYTRKWLRYILIALLLNGISITLFRFIPKALADLYILYLFGLSTLGLLVYRLTTRQSLFADSGVYWVSACSAISQCLGIVLTIWALAIVSNLSSQTGLVVFPITNGLPIPIGVVMGSVILKQKVTLRVACGVGLACIATTLLALT